ncbi:hypothetical protein V1507DRAFT_438802 [Lipomyces tetrasporus]
MISPFLVFSGLCLLISAADIVGYLSISLYLHPYAKYPGPLAAKLTDWYAVYHTYIGDLHTDVWECHGKYGVHASISTIDNTRHKAFRRLLNQGSSAANVRSMDAKLRTIAVSFARAVGEKQDRHDMDRQPIEVDTGWSVPKNMAQWCDYFTFDVMSELVFGTSYDLLNDAQNHFIIDGIVAHMQRFGFLLHFPGLEKIKMNYILFPHARRKAMRFYVKSKQIMEERKARGEWKARTMFSVSF